MLSVLSVHSELAQVLIEALKDQIDVCDDAAASFVTHTGRSQVASALSDVVVLM